MCCVSATENEVGDRLGQDAVRLSIVDAGVGAGYEPDARVVHARDLGEPRLPGHPGALHDLQYAGRGRAAGGLAQRRAHDDPARGKPLDQLVGHRNTRLGNATAVLDSVGTGGEHLLDGREIPLFCKGFEGAVTRQRKAERQHTPSPLRRSTFNESARRRHCLRHLERCGTHPNLRKALLRIVRRRCCSADHSTPRPKPVFTPPAPSDATWRRNADAPTPS